MRFAQRLVGRSCIRDSRSGVGKLRGEIGPRRDFQKHLWQINPRQSRVHLGAELHQAVGLIEFIQWRYDQVIFTVHLFHASAWIGGQIRNHRSIGLIEFPAEGGDGFLSR